MLNAYNLHASKLKLIASTVENEMFDTFEIIFFIRQITNILFVDIHEK